MRNPGDAPERAAVHRSTRPRSHRPPAPATPHRHAQPLRRPHRLRCRRSRRLRAHGVRGLSASPPAALDVRFRGQCRAHGAVHDGRLPAAAALGVQDRVAQGQPRVLHGHVRHEDPPARGVRVRVRGHVQRSVRRGVVQDHDRLRARGHRFRARAHVQLRDRLVRARQRPAVRAVLLLPLCCRRRCRRARSRCPRRRCSRCRRRRRRVAALPLPQPPPYYPHSPTSPGTSP